MLSINYLVVGSGLTGATIARTLWDAGLEVLVLERRPHLGGNVYDKVHPSGIRYHVYGPHYFRTNSEKLWDWVTQFCPWDRWEAKVLIQIGNNLYRWPLTIDNQHLTPVAIDHYNRKMWGITDVPDEVRSRVESREDDHDPRLKTSTYQGLPRNGYTEWVMDILRDIPVRYPVDYLANKDKYHVRKKLIWTGPIDEYYGFQLGKLIYRCQQRVVVHRPPKIQMQPVIQVNQPELQIGYLRSVEWNHLMVKPNWENGSLITYEIPTCPTRTDSYEYPFRDRENTELYEQYRKLTATDPKLVMAGRLGEYRYYDMDQAIARGLTIAQKLIDEVS